MGLYWKEQEHAALSALVDSYYCDIHIRPASSFGIYQYYNYPIAIIFNIGFPRRVFLHLIQYIYEYEYRIPIGFLNLNNKNILIYINI